MTVTTDDTLPTTPRAIRDEMIAFGVMTALLLIVPLTGVYPFFVMQALCFALLACAFNLLIGYGGLLSFGHAMFLGTAGYVTAHALKVWGVTPELGILIGTAAAAGLGVGLAALAGVLSAPINQVRPLMGADLIIVVFAVVVIGGMGSIMGSIITGFALGVIEGMTKYFYPEASNTVVFVLMVLVLLVKPSGLTGRAT